MKRVLEADYGIDHEQQALTAFHNARFVSTSRTNGRTSSTSDVSVFQKELTNRVNELLAHSADPISYKEGLEQLFNEVSAK